MPQPRTVSRIAPLPFAQSQWKLSATLHRNVIVISAGVWLAELVMATIHSLVFTERFGGIAATAARTLWTLVAIAMCLGIHRVLLRWGGDRPWPLFAKALVMGALASALLVPLSMIMLLGMTDYYDHFPDHWMDPPLMAWNFLSFMWMMCAWAALYVGGVMVTQVRERDAQLAAAHSAAQQAQLQALRAQINPHFLFNALNTLSGLIGLGRNGESDRIVMDLSRLLRHTLTRTPCELVPLGEEIAMVRRYLDIEMARFPDRLQVDYRLPADCEPALVPALVLLPLAENSIKYALAGSEEGITITIGARREGDALLVWLEDAGGTGTGAGGRGLGIGLSNLHQQLAALYGDRARLDAGPSHGGWRNLLRVPWQEEST